MAIEMPKEKPLNGGNTGEYITSEQATECKLLRIPAKPSWVGRGSAFVAKSNQRTRSEK